MVTGSNPVGIANNFRWLVCDESRIDVDRAAAGAVVLFRDSAFSEPFPRTARFGACIRKASYKKRIGGRQIRVGRSVAMSNREIGISSALDRRIADLKARMLDARITEYEMKAFQKVASIMGGGEGSLRLDADDLIAASFVVDALGKPTLN
jgi:hypothetical protein